MIMEKMALRRDIARNMEDGILHNVMKELNAIIEKLKVVKTTRSDNDYVEATLVDADNVTRKHMIDLMHHSCSCRQWQVTGKLCRHALGWICANRGIKIEDYVHEYYSVHKFRAAYACRVAPMTDRSQWPVVNLGFKVYPPKQKRGPGRSRVQRMRGALEPGVQKRKVKCKRCGGLSHFEKTCKLPEASEEEESPSESTPPKKRKSQTSHDDIDGSNTLKKKSTSNKRNKKTPKKKRMPKKRKKQAAASAPPAKVVRKLSDWLASHVML